MVDVLAKRDTVAVVKDAGFDLGQLTDEQRSALARSAADIQAGLKNVLPKLTPAP